ncbi:MAG TPA: hypothetical protein VH252_07990 [Chthoniobacterales bacterium]|nr:hypothetical protein [Chthoniobacterales bacterium]
MPAKTKIKNPAKPHSLKKIVKKIKDDPEYAKFIRGHMRNAKKGDKKSKAALKKHYKPTKREAVGGGLDAGLVKLADCTTPTTFNLLQENIT